MKNRYKSYLTSFFLKTRFRLDLETFHFRKQQKVIFSRPNFFHLCSWKFDKYNLFQKLKTETKNREWKLKNKTRLEIDTIETLAALKLLQISNSIDLVLIGIQVALTCLDKHNSNFPTSKILVELKFRKYHNTFLYGWMALHRPFSLLIY